MLRNAARVVLTSIVLVAGLSSVAADDAVYEAQGLLKGLGYDPGPVDGAIGKRTISAIERFMAANGASFDGTIDLNELEPLRLAAAALVPTLKFPGRLFDTSYGKQSACNALAASRYSKQAAEFGTLEPVAALNDSVSVGGSQLWDKVDPWLRMVLSEAGRFSTVGDATAGEQALAQLEKWAAADAVLKTPVDNRYSGRGNRGAYRPSAAAPVLDMENAAQLGYAIYFALQMLEGLPAERMEPVRRWADRLVDRFGGPIGDSIFASRPTGIWRLEGRPLLARAILEGDEAAYRDHVEAYYAVIRRVVSETGAILKNANRGDRALHYQSQGLLAITAVLDIVDNQDGRIPADIEARLHQAVTFFLDADRDNRVILPLAREGYNNPGDGSNPVRFYRENAEHYWWMIYYISKYPDGDNAARLRNLLALYDTYDRVSRDMMASTWVPYPINCYRPFDMSEAALTTAAELVQARFPDIDDGVVRAVEETGIGGVTSSSSIAVESVTVMEQYRERNFIEFGVRLNAAVVDGEPARIPRFDIYADFAGSADKTENLELLRLVVYRSALRENDSRDADYLGCGELSAVPEGQNDQSLRLHVGHGADKNKCVLAAMHEADRKTWSTVLANFGALLAQARPGEPATRVQELFARVE